MSAVVGLDFGSKHIGIASGDSALGVANPLDIWLNNHAFTGRLKDFMRANSIRTVVIGLPLNLNGEDTAQTTATREFGAKLQQDLGCTVVFQAESGTSVIAKHHGRQGRVDDHAAAIILQDYFEEQRRHHS